MVQEGLPPEPWVAARVAALHPLGLAVSWFCDSVRAVRNRKQPAAPGIPCGSRPSDSVLLRLCLLDLAHRLDTAFAETDGHQVMESPLPVGAGLCQADLRWQPPQGGWKFRPLAVCAPHHPALHAIPSLMRSINRSRTASRDPAHQWLVLEPNRIEK